MKTRANILILTHVILPLFVGGMLYVLFRSKHLLMFNWFFFIGLESILDFFRATFYPIKERLPNWAYYSLPDALWTYSFTSSLFISWGCNISYIKYWIIIPIYAGVISEFAQLAKLISGTFCIVDLVFSTLAIPISILLTKNHFDNGRV